MRKKENNKQKKYALVLSGGGFLGAFQVGALNYISDNWNSITGLPGKMKFDLVAGVSVGSINGAMIAMNRLGLLNELWIDKIGKNGAGEIYTSDFIDTDHKGDQLKMKFNVDQIRKRLIPEFKIELPLLKKLALIFSKRKRKKIIAEILGDLGEQLKAGFKKFRSLADNTPLKKKLTEYLKKERIRETDFICGFVSLDTGKYHSTLHSEFEADEQLVNAVLSSSCIPIVFDPLKHLEYVRDAKLNISVNNIDGGVNNVSPLGDVVEHIANDPESEYEIIIVNCHSGSNLPEDFSDKNIAQIAARSLYEIAFTEIFNNDVKHFLKINDLVKQAKAWDNEIVLFDNGIRPFKAFNCVVIQPHEEMDLGHGLVANEKLIALRMNHGELMAKLEFKKSILND
ncbi:MAG: patatin-like phospholipase family protein [Crocinitomicaceae bacterium]|nr:patatin-like phospholipase family protein [Crocinitomicaceae bacterium]